jgi:hypothetical protein
VVTEKCLMRLRRNCFLLVLVVMVSTWLLQRRSCWTVRPSTLNFDVYDRGTPFKSNLILFVTYTRLADVNASVAKCL